MYWCVRIAKLDERGDFWRAPGPVGQLDEVDGHERAGGVAELEGATELARAAQQDRVCWLAECDVGERGARAADEGPDDFVARERGDGDAEAIAVQRQLGRSDWHSLVRNDVLREPLQVIAVVT